MTLVMLAGCGEIVPEPADKQPNAAEQPGGATGGRMVRVDDIELSTDGAVVTLKFTGSPEFAEDDPCIADYVGMAEMADGILEVAVFVTVDRGQHGTPLRANVECTDLGYERSVVVELPEPFAGGMVRDLADGVRFTRAPDGLVELSGLPARRTLQNEFDLRESPTGRWLRVYTSPDGNGRLELIQAFDAPANVDGGDQRRKVTIGDVEALLSRHAPSGELVPVWRPGADRLALADDDIPACAAPSLT